MEESNGIKIKYLDTSSIAKLYLEEDGSSRFRNYFINHTNFCTALMTFYEAMNVIKSRLFKRGDSEKYYHAVTDLAIHGWGGKIELEPIDLSKMEVFKEVSKLASENNLDVADAIQIYAILNGKYSHWCQDSASVLITADQPQELTAIKYGIRVWNCRTTAKPEWLDN
jgi:predicted nucleic acid-binding protein